jgi:oligopeptide transport system substrate-binding protein
MFPKRSFVFALPLFLLACSSAPEKPAPAGERYGGIFNFNEAKTLRNIFPPEVTSVAEQRVASQIYEGLVGINPKDLKVRPALAEDWEVDSTGVVYTFHLRPGVRFHDDPAFPDGKGRELTAEDVAHCFTMVCTKGFGDNAYWLLQGKVQGADNFHDGKDGVKDVSGIRVIDEATVQFTLTAPDPNFLYSIAGAGCWIWPKELTEAYGTDPKGHGIGTGPFRLVETRPGDALVLQRNANYWGVDEEGRSLPYLDGVRITLVPDQQREMTEFLRGGLHMVSELSLANIGLLTDSIDTLTGQRRFSVSTMPTLSVQFYGLNSSKPPFNDIRVRRAFALAIDRQMLVDSVLRGMAVEAEHGLVPPGFSSYPYDMVHGTPFAPDSARKLLASAGFPGGKGFPRVQLQVNNGFGYRETASFVQDALERELGVGITISSVPDHEYFDRIERGTALFWREGWVADLPDPENFLALLDGRNAVTDTALASPLNTTRFADPRFDGLLRQASEEKNDTQRNIDLASAEELAMRSVPLIPLYHERSMQLTRPNVMGLQANALELLDLRSTWFHAATVPKQEQAAP